MTVQLSVSALNTMLDSIETTVGTAPVLQIRTGAPPASCASGATGSVLVTMTLPSDWMSNAVNGTKTKNGTWEDTSADGSGTAGHFRIWDSTVTTCHLQGTVTATGGGGDMTVDNTSINTGQDVVVTSFSMGTANS
jgi:hypothetical protein